MNSDLFSVDYFKKALRLQIEKNSDIFSPTQTMNSYYRTVVSAIIQDRINKNFELMRRIRNLDTAYREIKSEFEQQQQMQQQ